MLCLYVCVYVFVCVVWLGFNVGISVVCCWLLVVGLFVCVCFLCWVLFDDCVLVCVVKLMVFSVACYCIYCRCV